MKVSASAPGKLVLIGEYVVLEGAQALVAAFNRRVQVTLTTAETGPWQLRSSSSAVYQGPLEFGSDGRLRPGASPEAGAPAGLDLCAAVVGTCLSRAGVSATDIPALCIDLRSDALTEGASPLGLGSSAAIAVALGAALRRALLLTGALQEEPESQEAFLQDLAAHREAQGGAGSGVDVAASFHGGLLAYSAPTASEPPRARPVAPPQDLELQCVWTGQSASTSLFLERVGACRESLRGHYEECMETMRRTVDGAHQALAESDTGGWLASVEAYHRSMDALGRLAGADIVSSPHQDLARLALAHGVAYKPSGAGGGDVGIAFASSRDPLEGFAEDARKSGYTPLNLAIDFKGVEVVEE